MAKAKQPPRVRTKDDTSANVEDEALVSTETEPLGETEAADETLISGEAPVPTGIELPIAVEAQTADEGAIAVETEGEALPRSEVESFASRGPGEAQALSLPATASIQPASLHAVFAEVTDYSKTSFENSRVLVKTLLGTKSFESAIRIQSEYAKTSYVDFVAYLTRILAIYSKLATEALERRSHIA